MLGTGTLSGPEKHECGCIYEMTVGGKEPFKLKNGKEKIYLEDNDEIIFTGKCQGDNYTIGFGECRGKITPALSDEHFF